MNEQNDYTGIITDGGLSAMEDGTPIVILELIASAVWDEEAGSYQLVDDGHDEITTSLILFDRESEWTEAARRLRTIIKWTSKSLADLAAMDLTGIQLAWRVEEIDFGDYLVEAVVQITDLGTGLDARLPADFTSM